MKSMEKRFQPFYERMKNENLPLIVIETFKFYYSKLVEGEEGYIPEDDIQPVHSLPDAEKLTASLETIGRRALKKTIIVKLNGGLGTSMGLDKAKSLLTVKNNLSFLDIMSRQALKANVPLLLMNSFSTREDSLRVLQKYPDLWGEIPVDFVQHRIPKINQENLEPALYPENPKLEWCPPGHGDIYTAFITSGVLDKLLESGYEYAFVSNSDNLGAVIDESILGYFVDQQLPFMMEAADRTEADKKGGHLAKSKGGQFLLREIAQCPETDLDLFQDTNRHKYFNTNNLWLNLPVIKATMEAKNNILGLPLIRNSKAVNPRVSKSPPVFQLETAMGAAIGVIEKASAIRVPRSRFAPVKNTIDLLAVRSNAYSMTEDFRIIPNPERELPPIVIDLDQNYYKLIDSFEKRFRYGPPSLIDCENLTIKGDIRFDERVIIKGTVNLNNHTGRQLRIKAGSLIEGE